MMKRQLQYCIAVLVFNIIIEICAVVAYISVCFRSDMATAVIFGSIALIGILPQPWLLLLLALPGGMLYALVAATLITFRVYRWLNRQGKLPAPIARLRTMRIPRMLAGGVFIVLLLGGIGYARFIDFPAMNNRVPYLLDHDSAVNGIRQNRSYCLFEFIDSGWLWQASVTPRQMTALRAQYQLHPITTDTLPKDFFDKSPYWWQPKATLTAHAYMTDASPIDVRTDKGMSMLALWDQQRQLLYMWIQFHF